MSNIINLTPHPLVLMDEDERIIEKVPSSGKARVEEEMTKTGEINGVPVYKKTYSKVEGLPDPKKDTYFYVSSLVASASERDDLLVPGEFIRDDDGRIKGIKSFAQL